MWLWHFRAGLCLGFPIWEMGVLKATFAICVHLRTGRPSTNDVKEEKTGKKGRKGGKEEEEGEEGKERRKKGGEERGKGKDRERNRGGRTGMALNPASRQHQGTGPTLLF